MKTYQKTKIAAQTKIPSTAIVEHSFFKGRNDDDFVRDELTATLQAFVYESTIDERELIYYAPRPTFLDWLLRRQRKVVFQFKAKDLLLNPPSENELRTYQIQWP